MHARLAALAIDERATHLRVAAVVPRAAPDRGQFVSLAPCQDNAVHGPPRRDDLVVHLIKQPGAVCRRVWPSAGRALAIGCADVKLNDLAVRLRWNRCREPLRAGSRHRQFLIIGLAVEPVRKPGGDAARRLVEKPRGDRHRLGGSWYGGRVNHVENHRRQVGDSAGVNPAGSTALGQAGAPVLPVVIGQMGLHQLERPVAAVV